MRAVCVWCVCAVCGVSVCVLTSLSSVPRQFGGVSPQPPSLGFNEATKANALASFVHCAAETTGFWPGHPSLASGGDKQVIGTA